MSKLKLSIIALSLLFTAQSHALIMGLVNSSRYDAKRPTTIIISGRGDELTTQFQLASVGAAFRTVDAFPDRQVVIIAVTEKNGEKESASLAARGVRIIEVSPEIVTEESIWARISGLRKIASLHVFAHMNPVTGAQLEQAPYRILPDSQSWSGLRSRFTSTAFAVLHGCNSAWTMAPNLAQIWGIPVGGTFTSADFQKYRADGFWYFNNDGQFPKTGEWGSANKTSFLKEYGCQGTCLRMRPDNFTYKGIWGDFKGGGLGIVKFFLPENRLRTNWAQAMALSLFEEPSVKALNLNSSQADFDDVVIDQVCPNDSARTKATACKDALTKAVKADDMTYDPFDGRRVQCDWTSCDVQTDCSNFEPEPKLNDVCKIVNYNQSSSKTTTFMDQVYAYRAGFAYLKH